MKENRFPGLDRWTAQFIRGEAGTSAIEFGVIAPVIIILFLGVTDIGKIAYDRTDMFSAAGSGAQYFMAGGSDLERAREIVLASWTEAPEDAVVTVDRFCECSAAEATCNVACPDGSLPDVFARIEIAALVEGVLLRYNNQATDTVRIR